MTDLSRTIKDLQRQLRETREGNAELVRRLVVTRATLATERATKKEKQAK